MEGYWKFQGGGYSGNKVYKGKYEPGIPRGCGGGGGSVKPKTSVGAVWTFSGTTQSQLCNYLCGLIDLLLV